MYTIKQAAERSGVNVALLRAWERRYRIVEPARTDSGYRLYDDAAIARLRAMRALVDEGWSPRQAAERVLAADAAELDAIGGSEDVAPPDPEDEAARTAAAFVDGAARLDSATIEGALDDIFARGSFERIFIDRIHPALVALGDGWASGAIDVAGEHLASAALVRRLATVFEAAGGSGGAEPVLIGLPPGARHEIGSLAFAIAARRAGLPVAYLGPDVPAASWVAAVDRTRARAVAIGVVMQEDVKGGDAVVRAIRETHPGLPIAVGGRLGPLVGDGQVIRLPDSLTDAVEALRSALVQGS